MPGQGLLHRISQASQRRPPLRRHRVPPAVAAQPPALAVQEERHPGEVVIEVELIEIDAAHGGLADEDEVARYFRNRFIETGNLPVEAVAVRSMLAAEDNEEGPVALARQLLGLVEAS
jgi:hypothetical protein